MAAKWLYEVNTKGVLVTPSFMDLLRSGDVAALRSLNKQRLTLLYLKEFTRASRRPDAEGLFLSETPPLDLIPFVRAGRHSPPAWIKDALVAEVRFPKKRNTWYDPKYIKRELKKGASYASSLYRRRKLGVETVSMKIKETEMTAWQMKPNPKFELVVINKHDRGTLLKLLSELDSVANVATWLAERTERTGATLFTPLFEDYQVWCDQHGETAAGKKTFSQAIVAEGVVKLPRSGAGERYELALRPLASR